MIPSWAWVVWITGTLTSFAILETVALANRRQGDTLSENIRRWLGIHPPSTVRRVGVPMFVAVLVGFVVWFIPHIVFSLW